MSHWDDLLLNLGSWSGSFTHLSPEGTIVNDTPSLVTLEGLNDNRTVRQTIQYLSPDRTDPVSSRVLEYSSLSRGVLFFQTGAFSQGSIQYGPFSEFGAELGFLHGDRRLRLVQLFNKDTHLSRLTLIREQRQGTDAPERPPLTVKDLIGTWQGNAITLYADLRNPDRYPTTLHIEQEGDRLIQTLSTPSMQFSSVAKIDGKALRFEQGSYPIQVLLLPDGASSNTPLTIPRGKPFLLEAGWLIDRTHRQRMIRSYDERGTWTSLTLVTEKKT